MALDSVTGEESNNEGNFTPFLGMIFDSLKDAYECYNRYGGKMGFSIKNHSNGKIHKGSGMLTSKIFACSKEGFRKPDKRDHLTKNPRAETRTGCGALMGVKLEKSLKRYEVYKFVAEHNHELIRPDLVHMLPSQRKISVTQSEQIDLANDSGIVLRQSYELMGRELGGRDCVGFLKLDQKNYLRTKRQRDLAYGEVGCILKYFQDKATENESFYYAFQLDIEEKITNIFWADADMIIDYGNFGDAVSFDTTYKTNKDCRPLGIFVGFNHHREVSIFGAALMYDETAESFIWLFETFLHAMLNKHPKTIFTDQDAAMAKALKQVMPDTFHRLCKWHIMQNAVKNLHNCFAGETEIKEVFGKFFKRPDEENDWLNEWNEMLDAHNVRENKWLKTMFQLKEKWAWPYVKRYWSAGMQSTQLSESNNAAAKVHLQSDFGFSKFFSRFENLVAEKRYKERDSDYTLSYRLPKHKFSTNRWLQHAGKIFTKRIFEELYKEFEKAIDIFIEDVGKEGDYQYFIISPPPGCIKKYRVTTGENNILSCNCKLFDMRGILCCHMIKVLKEVMRNLEIPETYILKRWTKSARSESIRDVHGRIIDSDPKKERTSRCKTMNSIFRKISSRASETEETYQLALKESENLLITVEKLIQNFQLNDTDFQDEDESPNIDLNEKDEGAKGVAKRDIVGPRGRRRIIGSFEKNMQKKNKKTSQSAQGNVFVQTPPLFQNLSQHHSHDPLQFQNQFPFQLQSQSEVAYLSHYQPQNQLSHPYYYHPHYESQSYINPPSTTEWRQGPRTINECNGTHESQPT